MDMDMDLNKNDENEPHKKQQYPEVKEEPLDGESSTKKSLNFCNSNAPGVISESEDNESKPNPSDLECAVQGSQKTLYDSESVSGKENAAVNNPLDMSAICDAPNPSNSNFESNTQHSNPDRREFTQKRKTSSPQTLAVKKPRVNEYEDNLDSSSETEEYCITLTDVPEDMHMTNYIKECGVSEDRVQLTYQEGDVKVVFQSVQDYKKVQKRLCDDRLKGKKLSFKLSDKEADMSLPRSTENINQSTSSPDAENTETQNEDTPGLYGLRIEFLRQLDITPPIDTCVRVTNFRCDKSELREVMELAGHVVFCSVINSKKRFAKVQYSHPLEAVQAISMLNGQMHFGMKLKLTMEPNPGMAVFLPKGLVQIGPGLGLDGRPIRDIAKQYENFTKQQSSTINPSLFQSDFDNSNSKDEPEDETSNNGSFEVKHAEDFDSSDDVHPELNFTKDSHSSESFSTKSIESPASIQDVREFDRKQTTPENFQRPIQKPPPQMLLEMLTAQHQPPYHVARPFLGMGQVQTSIHHHQGFRLFPVHGPGPVQRPGLVRGPGPVQVPAQVQGPGPVQRPGPFQPPRLVHGPGPVQGLDQVQESGSVQVPGQVQGPGPVLRPGLVRGLRPIQGQTHRPGVGQGPSSVSGSGSMLGSGPGPVVPPRSLSGPNPASGSGPVSGSGSVCRSGPKGPQGNKVTVEFANLPPSTTFPLLCDKLTQCGQMTSLRFTTPGCAVATFSHPSHAERCYQNYNGMVVEGHRITVTII